MMSIREIGSQDGQGIVEYSMLMGMVAIAVVMGFVFLAPQAESLFSEAADGETVNDGQTQVTKSTGVDIPCADQIVGGNGSGGSASGSGGGSATCRDGSGSGGGSGVGGGGSGGGGSGGGGGGGGSGGAP